MIVGTRRLFLRLLPVLTIDHACDIGSMDGADALAFRRALPAARVLAFEPNPHNFARMRADARFAAAGIELLPLAANDRDGPGTFHLVDADYTQPHHRRGMSSLFERADATLRSGSLSVDCVRLDRVLAAAGRHPRRIALWIDVEGKGFEALEGARGILDEVWLIHIEVEARPCISTAQHLYPEVDELLTNAGFERIATSAPPDVEQWNAVYVRSRMSAATRARVALARCSGLVRHRAGIWLTRHWPSCASRLRQITRT
jgi:FkbM family methyltransferase